MDHNPDRIAVWPGYFDAKASRRSGRRVPKDSSVLKPDLEGLFIASRALGLKKINSFVVREMDESLAGMLDKVQHLVETEDVK